MDGNSFEHVKFDDYLTFKGRFDLAIGFMSLEFGGEVQVGGLTWAIIST